jgi:hypothetical protein
LAWYQLPAISVALAWGMFALLLCEFPELAKQAKVGIDDWASSSWRLQAYVALGGSFVRIFISNFNVPGWRSLLCVALLAPIYFYVYWNLGGRQKSRLESEARIDLLAACLGTATLGALARFELAPDAVVIGYAALVVAALLAGWLTQRLVFVLHGLVLLGFAAFRMSMGNFYHLHEPFGSSLSSSIIAIALLACAVPLAYQVRKNEPVIAKAPGWFGLIVRQLQQPMFFVPVVLLVVLLFLKLSGGKLTGAWGVEGFVVFVLALWAKERSFRLTGLSLVMMSLCKLVYDAFYFGSGDVRAIVWIGVGILALLVALLYAKNREALREYL